MSDITDDELFEARMEVIRDEDALVRALAEWNYISSHDTMRMFLAAWKLVSFGKDNSGVSSVLGDTGFHNFLETIISKESRRVAAFNRDNPE